MAKKSGGRSFGRVVAKGKYSFLDPEEIANRDAHTFQNPATHFVQPATGDSGRNMNEPSLAAIKQLGGLKFDQI